MYAPGTFLMLRNRYGVPRAAISRDTPVNISSHQNPHVKVPPAVKTTHPLQSNTASSHACKPDGACTRIAPAQQLVPLFRRGRVGILSPCCLLADLCVVSDVMCLGIGLIGRSSASQPAKPILQCSGRVRWCTLCFRSIFISDLREALHSVRTMHSLFFALLPPITGSTRAWCVEHDFVILHADKSTVRL
jgi:hypothetical protein